MTAIEATDIQGISPARQLIRFDERFADLMLELSNTASHPVLKAIMALLSLHTTRQNHTCLDLHTIAEISISDVLPDYKTLSGADRFPTFRELESDLRQLEVVGSPGEFKPVVLDENGKLYLYRYWYYEHQLAESIRNRVLSTEFDPMDPSVTDTVHRLFGESATETKWQRQAVQMAATGRFSVITGGPGTGKTFTVASILAVLLEQTPDLAIALCAPTGKAAARLQESISLVKSKLRISKETMAAFPDTALTIHRFLGVKTDGSFRYHANNPVTVDAVIVDEASMVSLALMAKLFEAVPMEAKIILLGDRYQLSSVEAGAVLANICDVVQEQDSKEPDCNDGLSNRITELKHSFRFEKTPEIGRLSLLVKEGMADAAAQLLKETATEMISLESLCSPGELKNKLAPVMEQSVDTIQSPSMEDAFKAHERFRILCSHRNGPFGVNRINQAIETLLKECGAIPLRPGPYHGMPILIKENDYQLNCFNGDTGILWQVPGQPLKAFFPDRQEGARSISLSRLPRYEPVYAMTIHESQGSEYETVLIILSGGDTGFLTRELLYTAITRATSNVVIWSEPEDLKRAICSRTRRETGLKDAIKSLSR